MRCKVKWRTDKTVQFEIESFENTELAKKRARDIITAKTGQATVELWNESETWQIVSAAGAEAWCRA